MKAKKLRVYRATFLQESGGWKHYRVVAADPIEALNVALAVDTELPFHELTDDDTEVYLADK